MKPVVYLLCGLPGSGKTMHAKNLEKFGALRLTLDEQLFERFGREYVDHEENQQETKEKLKEVLRGKIAAGQSVILDFGFWKKTDRDEYKKLIEDNGGQWRLLYFKAGRNVLMERLASRNINDRSNNHVIDEKLLDKFSGEFEAPTNEGETVIEQ
jgi:predicted kinase